MRLGYDIRHTMQLRTYETADFETVLALNIDTFGPFMADYREHVGDIVFTLERADWQGTYARQIPTLHAPADSRWVVIAEDGTPGRPGMPRGPGAPILGYVAWAYDPEASHGTIELLAVGREHRGRRVATTLCQHAMDDLRARGARTLDVGTGGDAFHAPARACYESLGFIAVPVVHYVREL